jgi:hypothetical protein
MTAHIGDALRAQIAKRDWDAVMIAADRRRPMRRWWRFGRG